MSQEQPAEPSTPGSAPPPPSMQELQPAASGAAAADQPQAGVAPAAATEDPQRPAPRGGALVISWVGVALVPFFLVGAFIVGYVLTGSLEPDDGQQFAMGADILTLVVMVAVLAVPCLLAAVAGGRAVTSGDDGGRIPRMIGIGAFLAFAVWAVVSFLWNWLALGIYN